MASIRRNSKASDVTFPISRCNDAFIAGSLVYAPIAFPILPIWYLDSPGITVNGKSNSQLKKDRIFNFASGTSNILLPQADAEVSPMNREDRSSCTQHRLQAVYAQISSKIKPYPNEPGTYYIPCSQLASVKADIAISITSTSGSTFSLTIPSSELSVGPYPNDPKNCQTLIIYSHDNSVIGASLLKHYYTVWDIENKRMGFAPNGKLARNYVVSLSFILVIQATEILIYLDALTHCKAKSRGRSSLTMPYTCTQTGTQKSWLEGPKECILRRKIPLRSKKTKTYTGKSGSRDILCTTGEIKKALGF